SRLIVWKLPPFCSTAYTPPRFLSGPKTARPRKYDVDVVSAYSRKTLGLSSRIPLGRTKPVISPSGKSLAHTWLIPASKTGRTLMTCALLQFPDNRSCLVRPSWHFRPYLLGKAFKVRTDHQSLQWLRNFCDPEGQVAQWKERLQEYDSVCEYRRGSRHGNADALSKITTFDEATATLVYDVDTPWAEDQLSDPYIMNIYKRQTKGSPKPSAIEMGQKPFDEQALWRHWKDLKLIDGVLYRMDQFGPKLIIPKSRVAAVLQKVHTELGHAGQLKS
ncbi:hypothetical protein EG68_11842, partial [Paragonimus skrjabini miyazakii]